MAITLFLFHCIRFQGTGPRIFSKLSWPIFDKISGGKKMVCDSVKDSNMLLFTWNEWAIFLVVCKFLSSRSRLQEHEKQHNYAYRKNVD